MMCNSVANQLVDDAFLDRLEGLRIDLGPSQTVSLMRNGVASRINNEVFYTRMRSLFYLLGHSRTTSMMNGFLSSRLEHDTFFKRLTDIINYFGPIEAFEIMKKKGAYDGLKNMDEGQFRGFFSDQMTCIANSDT